ncbi:uncharacterized protein LOC134842437 [Symsagittifera roscoffensis]|uniref:uncharacterized protein LOC134842437 n=1 Tax=Symsagittifera roscoffensis TaxID=84072 RepID=UPI00307C7C66
MTVLGTMDKPRLDLLCPFILPIVIIHSFTVQTRADLQPLLSPLLNQECFNWAELKSGFRMHEEACEYWHNKNTIYDMEGEKSLEMESQCMKVIDMKMFYHGRYVGKIDYASLSWGFDVKVFDCHGVMIARAKEETSDFFMNSFRARTVITLYDYSGEVVGYSLRNNMGGTTIELQTLQGEDSIAWMAVRKQHAAFMSLCSNPEWTVMNLMQSNSEAGDLADPVYITALVAIEGMKQTGDHDMCTFVSVAGIVIACLLVLAVVALATLIFIRLYSNIQQNMSS